MTPTDRLYLRDSLLLAFDGRVVARSRWKDAAALVLDRSAFYPEGGGQLGDTGTLSLGETRVAVVDVQIDEAGLVHHILANDVDDGVIGAPAQGEIDRLRRRDHMSQHTGQHMLSSALLEVAKAETVSSRLGADTSTIDVDVAGLSDALAARAEDHVNDAVLEDREVRILFPTPAELAELALRRPPKVDTDVRVIDVRGYDVSPCGGTHCQRTGQVGPLRIVGLERYKGGTRVTFVAGKRAISDYARKDGALRELAKSFSCGPLDVPLAVGKLRTELRARMDLFGVARGELMTLLAAQILAGTPPDPSGTTRVFALREADDLGGLRALAGAIGKRPDVVAIAASRETPDGDWLVVVERGPSATFDAGAWLKKQAAAHGGRGGGRAEHAEGRFPASVDLVAISRD